MASHLLIRACFRNYQRFTAGAVAARHRPWCSSATNPLSDEAEEKTRSGGGEFLMTARSNEEVRSMFEQWIVEYGKVYNTLSEKEKRFQIFKDRLNHIDKTNAENLPYKLGLNKFADLTVEELMAQYTGLLFKNHPTRSDDEETSCCCCHSERPTSH